MNPEEVDAAWNGSKLREISRVPGRGLQASLEFLLRLLKDALQ
jgi:hypothetical protein